MVNFALYRWIRVFFGARSFVKRQEGKLPTFVVVKGKKLDRLVQDLFDMGYVEEWPRGMNG